MDHLPFGEDASVVGESEKHRFTTYERDAESGTDYAINRQYATSVGRFLQPDPLVDISGTSQSLNLYAYSTNEPVDLVDPLGLTFFAQNQSVCPAQFSNCATVTVIIGGQIGEVMVGLDGLGGGTFIWGNSTFTDAQLSRFNELIPGGLPRTFNLLPSLELQPLFAPDLNNIREQIRRKALKDAEACANAATAVLRGQLDKAALERQSKQVGLGVLRNIIARGIRYALGQVLETGMLSSMPRVAAAVSGAHSALTLMAHPAAMVAGLFIGMSVLLTPGEKELNLMKQISEASKACKETVFASYGLKF
jgi:RHS repeat-associated protein